ncbi:MAG: translocation/assembly module TamB domain-containing protein [Bacteroidota bacterium]
MGSSTFHWGMLFKNEKDMIKKGIKIVSIIFTVLAGLLILLLVLLHSGSLNNILSWQLSRQISKSIQGELVVSNISGSVFNNFTLHNIRLKSQDTTLVTVKSVRVSYSLSGLIEKRLKVHLVDVNQLGFKISQQADSSWNVLHLLEPVSVDKQEKKSSGEPFFKKIDISRIIIDPMNGSIKPSHSKDYIPKDVQASLELNFYSETDQLRLAISKFEIHTRVPAVRVKNLSGEIKKSGDTLQWSNMFLELAKTKLKSTGSMPLDNPLQASAKLHFYPLDLSDIRAYLKDLNVYGAPDIEMSYSGKNEKKQLYTRISREDQKLTVNGWLEGLEDSSSYHFNLSMDSLNGEPWTRKGEHRLLLSGNMEVSGKGFDKRENTIDLKGDFTELKYGKYALDKVLVNLSKNGNRSKGRVSLENKAGTVTSSMQVSDLFGKMNYALESKIRAFDIAYFVEDSSLKSSLNLDLKATGKGIEIASAKTDIYIKSKNSQLIGKPVDDFETALLLDNGNYTFTGFQFKTPYFLFKGEGEGHLTERHHIKFFFEPYDLNPLLQPLHISQVDLKGSMSGIVAGSPDSLHLQANLSFEEAAYDTIRIKNLKSTIDGMMEDSTYAGFLKLTGQDIEYGSYYSDSINLSTHYGGNRIDNQIYYKLNDSLSTDLEANIELGEVPLLHLPALQLNLSEDSWSGGSDSTFFAFGKDTIRVNHFQLTSGEQEIRAHGRLAFKGNEDLSVRVKNADLKKLTVFGSVEGLLSGQLNTTLNLNGTAKEPFISGEINIDKPSFQQIAFRQFNADFQYSDERLELESSLDDSLRNRLHAFIKAPVHISLEDSIALLRQNTDFIARLAIDSLNTSLFNPVMKQYDMRAGGYISSSIEMTHTIEQPQVEGKLQWLKGSFFHGATRLVYHNIELASSFSNERLSLDQLDIHSGKGSLRGSGYINIRPFSPEFLNYIDIQIDAKEFKALEASAVEATINSNLTVKGPYEAAKINGHLTVLQSALNADVLQAEFSKKGEHPNPPLLVQALQDTIKEKEEAPQAIADTVTISENTFYNNLSGSFLVKVPGNTWVKGEDMNFELNGELRAVKEDPQIDLFGDLNVNRGYYKFYGKRFTFEKGKLTFTGGSEINPVLDFVVVYTFRDENQQLRKLRLYLTERALNPEIRFTLDNSRIEEKDAVAYILFGRRMENLTGHQATTVEQSALNITTNLALGQLSNVLQDALQSSLHLDVVEISGENTWRSGKVTLGKYITDDLYLRYEQNFSFDKRSKTIEPEKIALEYQILRSLFLQATNQKNNSGFDLIFKKSWK